VNLSQIWSHAFFIAVRIEVSTKYSVKFRNLPDAQKLQPLWKAPPPPASEVNVVDFDWNQMLTVIRTINPQTMKWMEDIVHANPQMHSLFFDGDVQIFTQSKFAAGLFESCSESVLKPSEFDDDDRLVAQKLVFLRLIVDFCYRAKTFDHFKHLNLHVCPEKMTISSAAELPVLYFNQADPRYNMISAVDDDAEFHERMRSQVKSMKASDFVRKISNALNFVFSHNSYCNCSLVSVR
jgi:hypothetical protein